jgi:hypothetical protein
MWWACSSRRWPHPGLAQRRPSRWSTLRTRRESFGGSVTPSGSGSAGRSSSSSMTTRLHAHSSSARRSGATLTAPSSVSSVQFLHLGHTRYRMVCAGDAMPPVPATPGASAASDAEERFPLPPDAPGAPLETGGACAGMAPERMPSAHWTSGRRWSLPCLPRPPAESSPRPRSGPAPTPTSSNAARTRSFSSSVTLKAISTSKLGRPSRLSLGESRPVRRASLTSAIRKATGSRAANSSHWVSVSADATRLMALNCSQDNPPSLYSARAAGR